jgi:flavin-dependent dehydrogenase
MIKNGLYDVIIAGSGPAGSTAATLLAQYGYQVLILDKDSHPRFHIGESMLPMAAPIMKRLKINWSHDNLPKGGAEFIDEKQGKRSFFPFQGKYRTFQVDRSDFDKRLFENAIKQGVTAHQQEKVINVNCHDDKVIIDTNKSYYQARYFIDASGRNAIMGHKKKSINKLNSLGKFALYQHYQLDDNPTTAALFASGNIEILLTELGWFWCIPLTKQRLSVGLVVQKPPPENLKGRDLFNHNLKASPRLNELLHNSKLLNDLKLEADFSYLNKQRYGQRYACCGDASGFLDPVFSSGFFFAVKTAEMIADQLHLALKEGREADINLHDATDKLYQIGFQSMYLMIERFYCSNLVENLFFEAERAPHIKEEIVALLAGDLWTENNSFQQGLLLGRNHTENSGSFEF